MFSRGLLKLSLFQRTPVRKFNVVVFGGASELGRAVSLILRTEPAVTQLGIYDTLSCTNEVTTDLSHIPSHSSLHCIPHDTALTRAINQADLVLCTGGIMKTHQVTYEKVVATNTPYIKLIASKLARTHPMPFVGVAMDPINIMVPLMAEIMDTVGISDKKKLFGITGVNALRAQAIYATVHNLHPYACFVPVIGGHSNNTLVPLFSKAVPPRQFESKWCEELTTKLRSIDSIVPESRSGYCPCLAVAHSVVVFTRHILSALKDDDYPTVVDAFIQNNDFGTQYFGGRVSVDKKGVIEMKHYKDITQQEKELLDSSLVQLRNEVNKCQHLKSSFAS